MQNLTKASFLALMIAAAPLWAQGTAPSDEPHTDAPAAEAPVGAGAEAAQPAPDAGLNMGTPEGQAANPGAPYTKETYDDWLLRCAKPLEDQPEQCQLYQLLEEDSGNPVAEINLFALPEGGQAVAGATIVTPLGTLLTEQVTLSVDGGQGKRYPFTFCSPEGCLARIGFTADDVAAFKAGNSATLTLVAFGAPPDQKVRLKVSLIGFTAGFDALTAMND